MQSILKKTLYGLIILTGFLPQIFPRSNKFEIIQDLKGMLLLSAITLILVSVKFFMDKKSAKNTTNSGDLSPLQNLCVLYEDLCKRVFEGVIKRKKQLESRMRAVLLPASKNFCRGLDFLIDLTMLIFLTLSCLSFGFAEVQSFGFAEIFMLMLGLLFFYTAKTSEILKKQLPALLSFAILTNVILGTFAFLNTNHSRFFGLFYNPSISADAWPNAFASFFIICFPFTCLYLFSEKNTNGHSKIKTGLKQILIGISLGAFYLSFSRAGFIALGIALAIALAAFIWQRKIALPKVKWRGTAFAFLTIALSASIFTSSIQTLKAKNTETVNPLERFVFMESEGFNSINDRKDFFKGALALTLEKPWLGNGPSTFLWTYPEKQTRVLALSDHPHNLLLKISSERGIPALLFFLIFLLLVFIRSHPFKKDADLWSITAWTALMGFFAHHMVDYNLNFANIFLIFWMIMGSLAQKSDTKSNQYKSSAMIPFLVIIIALSGLSLAWEQIKDHKIKNPTLGGWWINSHIENSSGEEQKMWIEKQLEVNPLDAKAWHSKGLWEENNGEIENAKIAYAKGLSLNSKNGFANALAYARILEKENAEIELKELAEKIRPLMEEYKKLYEINLHFTQKTNEISLVHELETIFTQQRLQP